MIIPTILPVRNSRRNGGNDIFETFFRGLDLEPVREMARGMEAFTPKVEFDEDEDRIMITAEMPGIKQEDVEISVKGDYLTIRGHKKDEREGGEGRSRYTERSYGEFERVISLHAQIDPEKVVASMKDGVLTLTLPKIVDDRERERKIQIRAN